MKEIQTPTDAMLAIADILESIPNVDVGMADMIKKLQDNIARSKALEKRNLNAMVEHLEKTKERIEEAIEGVKFMIHNPCSGSSLFMQNVNRLGATLQEAVSTLEKQDKEDGK